MSTNDSIDLRGEHVLFWAKVDKNGPIHPYQPELGSCWTWTAGRTSDGYGAHTIRRKQYRAHRIAWTLVNGPIPYGKFPCHSCDNPLCQNPSHMFIGANVENMADMCSKQRDRHPTGEKHGLHKLTEDNVRLARTRYDSGKFTTGQLAALFKVSKTAIHYAVMRKTWRHVV